jgi:hypothetical protein
MLELKYAKLIVTDADDINALVARGLPQTVFLGTALSKSESESKVLLLLLLILFCIKAGDSNEGVISPCEMFCNGHSAGGR